MALRIALLTGLTALASSHRLQDSGSIDSGFNIGTGFNNTVQALAVTSDGSGDVYAAGSFSTYNGSGAGRIIRINPDGSVDGSFDVGSGFSGLGNVVMALALALDGSGDVYAGGAFTGYNGAAANWIARLNANGSIDSGFNAGAGFDDNPWSLVVATDGSGDVYVAGYFSTYGGNSCNRLVRLNPDGTIDSGFNVGSGFVGSGFNASVVTLAVALDGSGDVYAGGNFSTYNGTSSSRIIRLNSNGTVDTAFNPGTGFDGGAVENLALASDGSGDVYAGGNFTSYNGIGVNRIIRLNPNGTVDTGFNVGTGANNAVRALAVATDGSGDIFLGGGFTNLNGTAIARLNADGTVDTGFNVGAGFNGGTEVVAPTSDGSGVYVGGLFTSYNGTAVNRMVRLNADDSSSPPPPPPPPPAPPPSLQSPTSSSTSTTHVEEKDTILPCAAATSSSSALGVLLLSGVIVLAAARRLR